MKKIILFLLFLFGFTVTLFSQPDSPILIDPPTETDLVELNATLDWSDVTGSLYYNLEISTQSDFINTITGIPPQIILSTYTVPTGILNPNTEYYWRVRVVTSEGPSAFSSAFSFRTVGTPSQEITNLVNYIIGYINTDQLNGVQGNILINRLESAQKQINLNNPFTASVHLNTFIFRVNLLLNSNMISQSNGNKLIYNANGIIDLLSEDSPVQSAFNNIPNNFYLEQNYPNPFNPSTYIEYSIPQNGNVSLKVFDMTGKEIAGLIDEYQNAGSYIANWNASGISSGVYFYKLTIGDLTLTKRMILAK